MDRDREPPDQWPKSIFSLLMMLIMCTADGTGLNVAWMQMMLMRPATDDVDALRCWDAMRFLLQQLQRLLLADGWFAYPQSSMRCSCNSLPKSIECSAEFEGLGGQMQRWTAVQATKAARKIAQKKAKFATRWRVKPNDKRREQRQRKREGRREKESCSNMPCCA